jgi:hypothetical protein
MRRAEPSCASILGAAAGPKAALLLLLGQAQAWRSERGALPLLQHRSRSTARPCSRQPPRLASCTLRLRRRLCARLLPCRERRGAAVAARCSSGEAAGAGAAAAQCGRPAWRCICGGARSLSRCPWAGRASSPLLKAPAAAWQSSGCCRHGGRGGAGGPSCVGSGVEI